MHVERVHAAVRVPWGVYIAELWSRELPSRMTFHSREEVMLLWSIASGLRMKLVHAYFAPGLYYLLFPARRLRCKVSHRTASMTLELAIAATRAA